jgi:hypothetical protein
MLFIIWICLNNVLLDLEETPVGVQYCFTSGCLFFEYFKIRFPFQQFSLSILAFIIQFNFACEIVSRRWRLRRPHYVHCKVQNNHSIILSHINVPTFNAFWEIYAEIFLLSPRSSSNSLANIKFNFGHKLQLIVSKTFSTGVQFCTVVSDNLDVCYICLEGEPWTCAEWLPGLHDWVETRGQERNARRCAICKECKHRRHV